MPSALFWGGQPASERLKHHTRPSPASHTDNPLLPSIHVLGCDIKIGDSDSIGISCAETHAGAAVSLHHLTFSLMNSQMILVISSPSISTTGWATLMRLSASVIHTYREVQLRAASHSQQDVHLFTAQQLPSKTQNATG